MEGDQQHADLGRDPDKNPSRGKLPSLTAVVVAWAILSTAVLGWVVTTPSGPSRSAVWDSDGWLLAQLEWSTGSAGQALEGYLASHNDTYGEDALNWTAQTVLIIRYGQQYGAGGFPSASVLNLTVATFRCTYYGLLDVHGSIEGNPAAWTDPSTRLYLLSLERSFDNLTMDFRHVEGGGGFRDPLTPLGPSGIASVRENATALFVLSQPFGQALIGSDCTIP